MSAALLVLALAEAPQEPAPGGTPAAGVSDAEKLEKVQERKASLEKELQRLRGEERSLLGEVEELELELRLRTEELEEIQLGLKRTRALLDATVGRVRRLEASLAAARPALAAHARALYKLGDMSYLRLLLSIDRPSDFFRGYRFVTTLARRDNARVVDFRADLGALADEKAELEQRTREMVALRAGLAAARRRLDAQRAKKTDLLTSIVERKETNAAYVVPGGGQTYTLTIQTLLLMTALTFLPAILLMMTSFTRIIIVLSLLRQALGTMQAPPNQILIGLSLFLTFFVMAPVFDKIYVEAYKPYSEQNIDFNQALEKGSVPLKAFMLRQTRQDDLAMFVTLSNSAPLPGPEAVPLKILVPAYVISELKTAFQIGFVVFIPFLIIDMVVASVLMSMGMMMLSPVVISLPFKLMLFVLVDGWNLLISSLVQSFYT